MTSWKLAQTGSAHETLLAGASFARNAVSFRLMCPKLVLQREWRVYGAACLAFPFHQGLFRSGSAFGNHWLSPRNRTPFCFGRNRAPVAQPMRQAYYWQELPLQKTCCFARTRPPKELYVICFQPMRQAYDYWQEVPWRKRKKLEDSKQNAWQEAGSGILPARKDLQASLCLACTPPSRGSSPLLPVCKSYQQCKKRPAKTPFARRVPPPSRGRSPLLPVCKSYQQCTRPTAGPSSEVLGYIYLLIQGSTAPEPPLAVGRQVIACLFSCNPGKCSQRGNHPTFGWGDTSAA